MSWTGRSSRTLGAVQIVDVEHGILYLLARHQRTLVFAVPDHGTAIVDVEKCLDLLPEGYEFVHDIGTAGVGPYG